MVVELLKVVIVSFWKNYKAMKGCCRCGNPSKSPKSLDELLNLLESRGLSLGEDKSIAKKCITECQYYRLMAYRFPFVFENNNDKFKEGISFDDIWGLYIRDRKLRFLIIDAIERIEVSLRSRWAHVMAMEYGTLAYENRAIHKEKFYEQNLLSIYKSILDSKEPCVMHFKSNMEKVPIWAVCEIMTFGQLAAMITSIREPALRNKIFRDYGIDEKIAISFLNIMRNVRNICAHHGRLWNKRLFLNIKFPKNPSDLAGSLNNPKVVKTASKEEHNKAISEQKSIYNVIVILLFLMKKIRPESAWKSRLLSFLKNDADQTMLDGMGFPSDWESRPIWND